MAQRKLAHIRLPGYGQAMWAYPRWVTPGPAQTLSIYDQPDGAYAAGVTLSSPYFPVISPGEHTTLPTMTRRPRIAAFHASNPVVFQSYFRVRWEGLTGLSANLEEGARTLQPNRNPNARGRAEGQAIMQYNPVPSAGELWPTYGDAKAN